MIALTPTQNRLAAPVAVSTPAGPPFYPDAKPVLLGGEKSCPDGAGIRKTGLSTASLDGKSWIVKQLIVEIDFSRSEIPIDNFKN